MTERSGVEGSSAISSTGTHRKSIFVVTALGAFMASLDLSIVNVAFPALERAFPHDARASLAWVLTGYAIVFGSLLVVAGRTADRLGSRRVFFFGLGVFCLGSFSVVSRRRSSRWFSGASCKAWAPRHSCRRRCHSYSRPTQGRSALRSSRYGVASAPSLSRRVPRSGRCSSRPLAGAPRST